MNHIYFGDIVLDPFMGYGPLIQKRLEGANA